MEKEKALELVRSIQESVEQMKIDDINDLPELAGEEFACQCCGDLKMRAGSLLYKEYLICNDCVLLTETALALGKITDVTEIIDSMEDKRFELLYDSMFNQEESNNNN